jgi:predicted nucleic acid-binding protein
MIVLIDTNVLLDCLQMREPHAAAATRLWKLAEEGILTGYISAISFNNVFYIARKQAGTGRALEAVKIIRRTFRTVPLDEPLIDQAIASTTSDLEDAIQIAAADHVHADYIVTRNIKDFINARTPTATAEEILALLQT